MKIIGPFLCLIVFGVVACKQKHHSSASKNELEHKGGALKKLEAKLNLNLTQRDNIDLYLYVADWYGTPHHDGGCDKSGIDCSCFVRNAYIQVYKKSLPRTAKEMNQFAKPIDSSSLHEGDLVFFTFKTGKVSHVGIYLKENKFAHVSTSKGVMINALDEAYYRKYYMGSGRVD